MAYIKIYSIDELEQELEKYGEVELLPTESFNRARYASSSEFESLERIELLFEPYLSIANDCNMTLCPVFRSPVTNRLYVGYVNIGGHGSKIEIKPITVKQALNPVFIKNMYKDYAKEINDSVDPTLNYKI
jgi:hypothetical protein